MSVRALALLFACAAVSPAAAVAAPRACILPEIGLSLAGEGAVDCGVARSGHARERRSVARCAQRAIARGKSVRFGVGVMGVDAFWCDVAVRDTQGRFYSLHFEWDVGREPVAFVGRCPAIDPGWKDPSGADHFGPRDCVSDDEAFERAAIRHP
jgi:hypothetical protein